MARLTWFEIPASDLNRATEFYGTVFGENFLHEDIGDGDVKNIFLNDGEPQGAISLGPAWSASEAGVIVYFDASPDLQLVLDRVVAAGGEVVEPKQAVDATSGYWGRFRDSEGNLIGLLSPE